MGAVRPEVGGAISAGWAETYANILVLTLTASLRVHQGAFPLFISIYYFNAPDAAIGFFICYWSDTDAVCFLWEICKPKVIGLDFVMYL